MSNGQKPAREEGDVTGRGVVGVVVDWLVGFFKLLSLERVFLRNNFFYALLFKIKMLKDSNF